MEQSVSDKALRILMLEDAPPDAELAERELRKAGLGFVTQRVDTRERFVAALHEFHPDLVLCDYHLPGFDGMSALKIVRADYPEIPVVMLTGALSDTEAAALLQAGAKDYVLKDRLARLGAAVQRVLSVEQGIRARKAAKKALRESLTRYAAVTENANDAIICMRPDGVVDLWNRMAQQMFGYSAEEAIGKPLHELIAPAHYRDRIGPGLDRFTGSGAGQIVGKRVELIARRKDGSEFPVELSVSAMNLDGAWHATGIVRDISERKQAQDALLRLNRTLRALSAGNHALVHGRDEKSLLETMCQATTEAGYVLAWVGYVKHDERKSIVPMAISGAGRGYVEQLRVTWEDEPRGRGPTGLSVRTGKTQICADIQADLRMEPWRAEAARYNLHSNIALPLKEYGNVMGSLTIYASEPDAFDADQVQLLEEMAADLAFGIVTLRTRHERDQAVRERQQYAERLRASLEEALQAISATVDPYTAGHQNRVAALAATIARKLGLPEEQVRGIHLAGSVHDLGKIHVPAEILSKPGALTDIEYMLIKTHAKAGYDILKGIEFPWPIAQAVLQHHERLDGSGYPQSLTGEQIIAEAKILAVADVVEAMTSDRPYRRGRGLEAALAAVANGRGLQFDPAAVDACIALFREGGFAFTYS
jgi:PAS domain S-box-containing protein